jgi:hypothetical protein
MYIRDNWYVYVVLDTRLKRITRTNCHIYTVRSEIRYALRLRYVDLVQAYIRPWTSLPPTSIRAHNDSPNADLQKVFANKIKRIQACIDAREHHFQHLL